MVGVRKAKVKAQTSKRRLSLTRRTQHTPHKGIAVANPQ
jgi:hypothetical protein